jgi:hypothetical protein
MVNRVCKILLVVTAVGFVGCCAAEFLHHHRFGHFVRPGVLTDVIVGNSDIGTNDMHYARLLNFSIIPFRLEGCKFASDIFGVPDSVMPVGAYRNVTARRGAGLVCAARIRGFLVRSAATLRRSRAAPRCSGSRHFRAVKSLGCIRTG